MAGKRGKIAQASSLTLFILTILLIMLILLFFLSSFLVKMYVKKASIEKSESVADKIVQENLFWVFMKQPFEVEINNTDVNITVYEALLAIDPSDKVKQKLIGKAASFFSNEGYGCFFIMLNKTIIKNCNIKPSKLQEIRIPNYKSKPIEFGLK